MYGMRALVFASEESETEDRRIWKPRYGTWRNQFEFNIKKLYADLRPSEQKVADYYLGYAGQLEELSLVPMAKAAGVSQPRS